MSITLKTICKKWWTCHGPPRCPPKLINGGTGCGSSAGHSPGHLRIGLGEGAGVGAPLVTTGRLEAQPIVTLITKFLYKNFPF